MRLLHVRTFDFTEFFSPSIPKYAIASHRWVVGAELELDDIREGKNLNSYGYQKVKGFAEYVRLHIPGLEWLWIDTCCIDRKSSPDLSEAINSMFRWYRNAEVCLAYLHDTLRAEDLASFDRSAWFGRGWTLQELLAPRVVIFLTRDWQVIGHKGRGASDGSESSLQTGVLLNRRIAAITQIDETILQDYENGRRVSIDEKLRWMKNRQTTREEDLSYCLLGILGVSMNIRYGDGEASTRARLLRKAHLRAGTASPEGRCTIRGAQSLEQLQNSLPSASEWPGGATTDGVGLTSLAIQLIENGRKIQRLYISCRGAPPLLEEIAHELETFGHALRNLERDRQTHVQNSVDDLTIQRCVYLSNRAGGRVRAAVDKLEIIVRGSEGRGQAKTVFDLPEVDHLCNELDGAKNSLAFAYQLYTESRHQVDTRLVLRMLADNGLELPQQSFRSESDGHRIHDPKFGQYKPTLNPGRSVSHGGDEGLPSQDTFEAVQLFPSTARRRSEYGTSQRRLRLRFKPWFASRIWDLSLDVAQTGWTYNLRFSNRVPENSLILEACRDGDLLEVQALFRQGKASPYDYSYSHGKFLSGDTTLSAAAESGNVQLCRYLIEVAGFPIASEYSKDPIGAYLSSRGFQEVETADALEMYRLLLDQPERDNDLDKLFHGSRGYSWWWACPGASCLRLIKDRSPLAFEDLPWEKQVSLAIYGSGHRTASLPAMFLEILGSQRVDSRIATAHDGSGRTGLHMMASNIFRLDSSYASTWSDFIGALVSSGANLHHQTKGGRTPLMVALDHPWRPGHNLQGWVTLLDMADVDLNAYGRVESAIWEVSRPSGFSSGDVRILGFNFGPKPQDWSLDLRAELRVPIYQLDFPPGAWLHSYPYRIENICWYPDYEEFKEPWPWEKVRHVTLYSSRNLDENMVGGRGDSFGDDSWAAGILGTQDDSGGIMRLIHNSSRPYHRPRSHSSPCVGRKRGPPDSAWRRPQWIPGYHACPFDGRVRIGSDRYKPVGFSGPCAERRCVKGIHDYDVGNLWGFRDGINKQMRRFRRRYCGINELRGLPYNAYHPIWKGRSQVE